MEAYRHAHQPHTKTSHLTKLYSDTKKSALTSLNVQPVANAQIAGLHRKYRIQKDRLIAWGLAWSDDEKGPDGNIDESVARAGLTETVDSVLRNIKEVTEEAERIQYVGLPSGLTGEKSSEKFAALRQPGSFDEARYEDLLRDLTTSIDILYDLSDSRKALARGQHPTFDTPDEIRSQVASVLESESKQRERYNELSFVSTDATLVNPSFTKPSLSPYIGLPSLIPLAALRLPEERPPPYEAVGVPSTTRMVAQLLRSRSPETIQNALGNPANEVPVLVEYADYDSTYLDTGVPPPLQRLESLVSLLQPLRADSQNNLSLLGYFEDINQPRIGLVYDLPYALQNKLQSPASAQSFAPLSLLKLVQKANKTQNAGNDAVPALEHRFRMAVRLVEQLYAFHANSVAHGNINSSSVLFTTSDDESTEDRQQQLRAPLWASFDLFSKSHIEGVMKAASFNIYKHPLDEPQDTERDFLADMKFDLYGLALVLIEIGLWVPIGDLFKARYTLADFKYRLERLWIPKLSSKCGTAFKSAVETCLRFSDEDDSSRLAVEGVYGIILQYLRRCSLLDDEGSSAELIPVSELAAASASSTFQRQLSFESYPISRQQSELTEAPQTSALSRAPTMKRSRPAATSQSEIDLMQESHIPARAATAKSTRPVASSQAMPTSRLQSFADFKRRVVLAQRLWRRVQSRRLEQQRMRTIDDSFHASNQTTKSKRIEFPWIPLPQVVLDQWNTTLCYQLQNLVEKALKGSPESSTISLVPYGESPETARPTLIVGCTSVAKVKQVLKRHFKYDRNVYDVRVRKDEVSRCKKSRRDREAAMALRSMAPLRDPDVLAAANPDYQEQPHCGASIGAFRDDEHLPPVSFGGIVLVDGHAYGMSVHHMLELDDDEENDELHKVSADSVDDGELDDDDDDTSSLGSDSDSDMLSMDDDVSTVRQGSVHSLEQDSSDEDADAVGDCPGIKPGDFEEIPVTQPALDDALDLDLHVDESDNSDSDSGIDEDHLLSYKLGQIHASSGLRRTAASRANGFKSISQSLPQEIDWALFELLPPRIHACNVVRGGSRYCSTTGNSRGDSFPAGIRRSADLACAKVHCLGRTSGLGSGVICSSMELVKIRGRSTFSASWTVAGDFGVGGDSGAWVIGNDDGRVCGHVLASRKGRTYICPMDLLLEDIRVTLGAKKVELPSVQRERGRSRVSSAASTLVTDKRTDQGHERLSDAMQRMRLAQPPARAAPAPPIPTDLGGGVSLQTSPIKPTMSRKDQRPPPLPRYYRQQREQVPATAGSFYE